MTTETLPIVVTEFLRPENSHEGVVYHVDPIIAACVERLNTQGMTFCCDIYSNGNCTVYVYDPILDTVMQRSRKASHSIATALLVEVVKDYFFDLASIS